MDFIKLILTDTLDLINATHLRDLMTPIFSAFWLTILALPLDRVDRRDWISFLTYSVFMLASGVTLFLAIPNHLAEGRYSGVKYVVLILALYPLIAVRWLIIRKAP